MAEGLRIKIEADTSQAEKALDHFVQTAQADGKAAAAAITRPMAAITPATNKAVSSLNKLPQATSKAKFQMVELSRVVQDLPFGFTAISNNLTQLIPGVGLAGLAFSGLVAALTFSQVGLRAWTGSSKGASEEAKKQAEAVDIAAQKQQEFASTISNAAQEVVSQSRDFAELRSQIADTSQEYVNLTDKIVKKGIAQALFDQKNEVTQKLLAQAIQKTIDVQKGTIAFVPEFEAKKFTDTVKTLSNGLPIIGIVEDKDLNRLKKAAEETNNLQGEIADINKLARSFGLSFDNLFKDKKIKTKAEVEFIPKFDLKALSNLLTKGFNLESISLNIRGIKFIEIPQTDADKLKSQLEKSLDNLKPPDPAKLNPDFTKLTTDYQKFATSINAAINSIQVDAIASIASGLGEALAGGNFSNIFKGFADVVGSGLQSIGKQLISFAVLAQLTEQALLELFTNPGLALGVGIALVAAGAALKASLSKGVSGFAQGGLVFGPTLGLVGEGSGTRPSNPEVIAPLDKLRSMIGDMGGNAQPQVLVARIRGNDLLLSNNRTGRANRR